MAGFWEGGDRVGVRNIDLIDVFGADNVVTVDAGVLERLNFPRDAAEVLVRVGLPKEVEPLPFTPQEPTVRADSPRGLVYVFGNDFGIPYVPGEVHGASYCVEDGTGEVWRIRHDLARPATFISSALESFVECLLRFEIGWRRIPEEFTTSRAVGRRWGNFLADELKKVDPGTLAVPDSYFSFMVRDIKNGTF
jgi:hypothetical protein